MYEIRYLLSLWPSSHMECIHFNSPMKGSLTQWAGPSLQEEVWAQPICVQPIMAHKSTHKNSNKRECEKQKETVRETVPNWIATGRERTVFTLEEDMAYTVIPWRLFHLHSPLPSQQFCWWVTLFEESRIKTHIWKHEQPKVWRDYPHPFDGGIHGHPFHPIMTSFAQGF